MRKKKKGNKKNKTRVKTDKYDKTARKKKSWESEWGKMEEKDQIKNRRKKRKKN